MLSNHPFKRFPRTHLSSFHITHLISSPFTEVRSPIPDEVASEWATCERGDRGHDDDDDDDNNEDETRHTTFISFPFLFLFDVLFFTCISPPTNLELSSISTT